MKAEVLAGILAVRDSGLTNMFCVSDVIELAKMLGFPETASWIRENRCEYARGIFNGFTEKEVS